MRCLAGHLILMALLAGALCHGAAAGTSIVTNAAPVTTLSDGRSGIIAFHSVSPRSIMGYVRHLDGDPVTITGVLTLPVGTTGPVPAVIILHGSSGITPGEWVWAKRMNDLGYASFVIDSFTGRLITETETDQSKLSMAANIADAYVALGLLASDPAIDAKRIAVMGFSRGGVAALSSALDPFRRAGTDGNLRFAAHVAFYPGCGISYRAANLDGSPILMLLGGKDDYTPAASCAAYAEDLRTKGAQVTVKTYANAYHAFDRQLRLHVVSRAVSARACHGALDIDTGAYTLLRGEEILRGSAAVAEAKACLSPGVTMGGDPEGQEQAPRDVEAFLKAAF